MLAGLGLAMVCGMLAAGEPSGTGAPPSAPQTRETAEIRDVILLLEDGPLHLRIQISLHGRSLQEARNGYVDRLLRSLDADADGKVTSAEAARSPLLAANRPPSAAAFLATLEKDRVVERAEIAKTVNRVGGELAVYRQDDSAADSDRAIFKILDANQSGFLEPDEIAAARRRIIERDLDYDECVHFEEFLPPPGSDANENLMLLARSNFPLPKVADMLCDAQEPLLARRLLKKYDRSGEGCLSAEELGAGGLQIAALDDNGNGKLESGELANFQRAPLDLELAVELTGAGITPALKIVSTRGARRQASERPDFARIAFPGVVLTLAHRPIDPNAAALAGAMRVFNGLDADANGYLDRLESEPSIRFERGLFDAIDSDRDGRIFGEELERYVSIRGEPVATTCRIQLHHAGHGFFEVLDGNGDGRISSREMGFAERSLLGLKRSAEGPLSPTEPVAHLRLEFVRGSYQLFGPSDSAAAPAPTFAASSPIGPVWFQRMDRNRDGDLTWNEFLGPKPVFERLDADRDGLLDAQEAERASDQ